MGADGRRAANGIADAGRGTCSVPGWVSRHHFLICDDEVMEEETSERTVDVEDEGDHAGE